MSGHAVTIDLTAQQAKDLWEALDHLGLDMQCRLPDAETTDPDDMDIAEQCKRTYDISQHVMALIEDQQTFKIRKLLQSKSSERQLEMIGELAHALENMLSDEPPWHREEEYRTLIGKGKVTS